MNEVADRAHRLIDRARQDVRAGVAPGLAVAEATAAIDVLAGWIAGCVDRLADTASVRIVGDGGLAEVLRSVLVDRIVDDASVAIDTTGDPATIASTLDELAPGGRLVVAAFPPVPDVAVDAYASIHRGGISIVAVNPSPPRLAEIDAATTALVGLGDGSGSAHWLLVDVD